jgi:NTE family protein
MRSRINNRPTIGVAVFVTILTSCSVPVVQNLRLGTRTDFPPFLKMVNPDGIIVFLALSGGGLRAAAFSYGVIEELLNVSKGADSSDQCRHPPCSIMGNLRYISAVSGGAFTATYYALSLSDPARFPFAEFKSRFLYRDNESELLAGVLLPFPDPFVKLAMRSYVAGNYYQNILFGNSTFKDLRPKDGSLPTQVPFLILNATDLVTGKRFTFTQEQFLCLGSSLPDYPLGYAVAASAAFPIFFSPIRIDNHNNDPNLCFDNLDYSGLSESEQSRVLPTRRPQRDPFQATDPEHLIHRERFLDQMNTPYLYLSDGGISDNLGTQAFLDVALQALPGLRSGTAKGLILISVDANLSKYFFRETLVSP